MKPTPDDRAADVPSSHEMAEWCERLVACGLAVRDRVRAVMARGVEGLAEPVAFEGGDTIFELDRQVEPIIEEQIASWPADCLPLILVAEGFGRTGKRVFGKLPRRSQKSGAPKPRGKFRVLMDPIDGTRGLMYDKRPAWFLAAVAVDRGDETRLSDAFASAMVELPTTRHGYADHFFATRNIPTQAVTLPLIKGDRTKPRQWTPRPSTAVTPANGFGYVVNFFPGGKELAAELLERIAFQTTSSSAGAGTQIYDDQYISTGGQMAELLRGHDRFCCDVRPLFNKSAVARGGSGILTCHPYDLAGTLVAQQAGVIIRSPSGGFPDCPFDVCTEVGWCGYANRDLENRIAPVIHEWITDLTVEDAAG